MNKVSLPATNVFTNVFDRRPAIAKQSPARAWYCLAGSAHRRFVADYLAHDGQIDELVHKPDRQRLEHPGIAGEALGPDCPRNANRHDRQLGRLDLLGLLGLFHWFLLTCVCHTNILLAKRDTGKP